MKKTIITAFLLCSLIAFTTPCVVFAAESTLFEGDISTNSNNSDFSGALLSTDMAQGENTPQSPVKPAWEYLSASDFIENETDESKLNSTTETDFLTKNDKDITTEQGENQIKAWSAMISETVGDYIGEIFCALTFIGSMITAFLYKKGLLPTLGDGINKICSVVVSSGEKATDIQKENAELLDAFVEKAMPILEKSQQLYTYAEEMRKESLLLKDELERDKLQRKALSNLIEGQIELLYGVFMSASLPEYQKEQLGAQYNRLKSMITEECEGAATNASKN